MVVVVIIGILATLAYASLIDIIFTSRAKETAQTMRTFAERALSESKRMNKTVTIKINNNKMEYSPNPEGTPITTEPLGNGYRREEIAPDCATPMTTLVSFNSGADSQLKIGISGIAKEDNPAQNEGYFAACDAKGYCGAAVKVKSKNSFVACIKKPKSNWEAL